MNIILPTEQDYDRWMALSDEEFLAEYNANLKVWEANGYELNDSVPLMFKGQIFDPVWLRYAKLLHSQMSEEDIEELEQSIKRDIEAWDSKPEDFDYDNKSLWPEFFVESSYSPKNVFYRYICELRYKEDYIRLNEFRRSYFGEDFYNLEPLGMSNEDSYLDWHENYLQK